MSYLRLYLHERYYSISTDASIQRIGNESNNKVINNQQGRNDQNYDYRKYSHL